MQTKRENKRNSLETLFRLGIELNSDYFLLFFTFLKNKSYFIQLFQILSHKVKPRNSRNELKLNFNFKKFKTQMDNEL
jgi:hypothetical protein